MSSKKEKSGNSETGLEYRFDIPANQSRITVNRDLTEMGLVVGPEICRSIRPAAISDVSVDWPANPVSSAWYETFETCCRQERTFL